MKVLITILFGLLLTSKAMASTPPDTIIAWFGDHCNRPNQFKAFLAITEYRAGSSYGIMQMVTVKDEYDQTSIRTAFEGFVRSISVDYDTTLCSSYQTDRAMWDYTFTIYDEPDDWPSLGPQVLSLYISWGFTNDLYPIATRLSYGNDNAYQAFVWDKMGVGFFQYIQNEVSTSQESHAGFAFTYLVNAENPSTAILDACVAVIRAAAQSSYPKKKTIAAQMMVDLYVKGFDQFRDDIIALQLDSNPNISGAVNRSIKRQQSYGRMLDFQVPAE